MPVNYIYVMNTHPEAFVSYHLILNANFCERTTLVPLIHIYTYIFAKVTLVTFSRWCGARSGSPQQHSHLYIYATLCCNDVLLEVG